MIADSNQLALFFPTYTYVTVGELHLILEFKEIKEVSTTVRRGKCICSIF
jgi:hypothetical protein